jgi:uncharacterized cupredoxin-like copper-binding protein
MGPSRRFHPLFLLAVLPAAVVAACAFGPPGATPPISPGTGAVPREVNIIARDYSFEPSPVELVAGETVLFHILNGGLEVHEVVIGDAGVQAAWETAEAATASAVSRSDSGRDRAARDGRAPGRRPIRRAGRCPVDGPDCPVGPRRRLSHPGSLGTRHAGADPVRRARHVDRAGGRGALDGQGRAGDTLLIVPARRRARIVRDAEQGEDTNDLCDR